MRSIVKGEGRNLISQKCIPRPSTLECALDIFPMPLQHVQAMEAHRHVLACCGNFAVTIFAAEYAFA
jgi:hypothetical protein